MQNEVKKGLGTLSAINIKISRDESAWEAVVEAEITAEAVSKYRADALKDIQKTAKLDGFRPGKAPEDRILAVYGETAVMRHAAEHAIESELPEILAKENVMIVEAPRVTTDTPENGKSLKFTARAALAPSIELPDYTNIAKKHRETMEDTSVSDKEHAEALTHLKRERARIDKMESGAEPQKAAEESRAMDEKDLPALDDAFVQALGYENAEKFTEAVRSNIKTEKDLRAAEKKRAAILDELVAKAKISYPTNLRKYELEDMEARLKDDLTRVGQTLEGYLNETKKTREQLLESWNEAAGKRAKVRLILVEIARKEKIEPEEKALEHELEHAKKHYPQADPIALRSHIAHAMRNEMTLRFLEGNKAPMEHSHEGHDH